MRRTPHFTPLSKLERDGNAPQVFYHFKDKTLVSMTLNAHQMPVRIDIANLSFAFKEGGTAFLTDTTERIDPVAAGMILWGMDLTANALLAEPAARQRRADNSNVSYHVPLNS